MTVDHPLRLEGVVKRFGPIVALNHVDLELEAGELLAVVGPSGCGKSTLLRTIAGLVDADGGQIHLRGTLVDDGHTRTPPERRRIGLVFQEHALFPHLTVAENVAFGLGHDKSIDREARTAEMLELVSLTDFGDRYPHELSGGERQRVAVARALAPAPDLMLFDEPFASLDPNLRWQLRADVVTALTATGTAALFVTHDQAAALAIGHRIAVLKGGEIAQVGSPSDLFHQPVSRFVAEFMGEASFLSVQPGEAGRLQTVLGELDGETSDHEPGSTVAMVRPDAVCFEPDPTGPAVVDYAEYRGMNWLLRLLLDGTELFATVPHWARPELGERGQVRLQEGHRQVALPATD